MSLSFSSEVRVNASPEAFFEGFQDLPGWSAWMKGLIRAERLTEGAFGPGTRWRETRRMFGHEGSEVFEVTEWAPPHLVALTVDGRKGTTGKGQYRFRYELMPQDDGTRVRLHGEIEMPGWIARLLGRLLVGPFRKACHRDLVAFKAHLERSGTAAGGGA